VLIVRDRNGQVCDFVLDKLNKEQIEGHLKPIIDSDAVLCTDGASWYKTFAKQENIANRRINKILMITSSQKNSFAIYYNG
jgi:hypothetical protein